MESLACRGRSVSGSPPDRTVSSVFHFCRLATLRPRPLQLVPMVLDLLLLLRWLMVLAPARLISPM